MLFLAVLTKGPSTHFSVNTFGFQGRLTLDRRASSLSAVCAGRYVPRQIVSSSPREHTATPRTRKRGPLGGAGAPRYFCRPVLFCRETPLTASAHNI
ncbi:hypothetical protein EVAR_31594_1 [Eumeta japonica]|uniref:Uncharacterized protein n=1 Tax=Eumeta variegata TaxID=151549 RepID=A0A4C1VZX1_EUMVA|nr:hypothetical protein EVAR_31594_1 [Eumeta japonica]